MALAFQVDGARALDQFVWKANISPAEVRLLGLSAPSAGSMTILLLDRPPSFDSAESRLTFDPGTAKLLNSGTSNEALLIAAGPTVAARVTRGAVQSGPIGDTTFLSSLPRSLETLGGSMLSAVRLKYPGELKFFPKSGRYVDSPDNFWTIKPQPRDVSFRITVRGVPESFRGVNSLELKPDQSGYSSCKITREDQLKAFSHLIDQIQRR